MKKSKKKLNEKGQSSVEYLLIVAVLVVAIFAFGDKLKTGLEGITESAFSAIGGQITNTISGKD